MVSICTRVPSCTHRHANTHTYITQTHENGKGGSHQKGIEHANDVSDVYFIFQLIKVYFCFVIFFRRNNICLVSVTEQGSKWGPGRWCSWNVLRERWVRKCGCSGTWLCACVVCVKSGFHPGIENQIRLATSKTLREAKALSTRSPRLQGLAL